MRHNRKYRHARAESTHRTLWKGHTPLHLAAGRGLFEGVHLCQDACSRALSPCVPPVCEYFGACVHVCTIARADPRAALSVCTDVHLRVWACANVPSHTRASTQAIYRREGGIPPNARGYWEGLKYRSSSVNADGWRTRARANTHMPCSNLYPAYAFRPFATTGVQHSSVCSRSVHICARAWKHSQDA